MKGFQIFRPDRTQIVQRRSVIVFLIDDVPNNAEILTSGSNDAVDWTVVHIKKKLHRFCHHLSHPSCKENKISVLNSIGHAFEKLGQPSITVTIWGKFYSPHQDRQKNALKRGSLSHITRKLAEALLNLNHKHFLQQWIEKPTRGNNILDLFLTNHTDLVTVFWQMILTTTQ